MLRNGNPLHPAGGLTGRSLKRFGPMVLLVALSMTGLVAADACGGGGGSCSACREDCAKNGIPASQCNCEGCTP
ncbi:hypothetical protein [Stigmatella erecta]|uniref:Uncharacterized protein n=1 Tax=Stigmatella erecta TaxID=83460 RepID=A0A1I0DKR8_9BACT|nr:hypothetical protein [Stigmatella erecta]SET32949.1 hypothetical protein SAMN05443639_102577 [Stigmatella erecta]